MKYHIVPRQSEIRETLPAAWCGSKSYRYHTDSKIAAHILNGPTKIRDKVLCAKCVERLMHAVAPPKD